jgi:hypothetical protein
MNIVTLQLSNHQDLELLTTLVQRLNGIILSVESKKENKSPIFWLDELAKLGGISSIQNPSEWQREIRTDRALLNRG